MNIRFAYCLGFHNWHDEHLARCLISLDRFPYRTVQVVDTGTHSLLRWLAARGAGAGYRFCQHPEWSRSWALNYATRMVRDFQTGAVSHYVFTDADMLFPNEWQDRAWDTVREDPSTVWLTDSRDFNEGFESELDAHASRWDAEGLWRRTEPHPRVGMGAAMIIPVDWFRKVRGFDETYKIWGCEDNDLVNRADWDGVPVKWLPDTFVAHQWHRRDWPTPEQYQQVQRNRDYLSTATSIIRNPDGWAGEE